MKRTLITIFGFICILTVLILGNDINCKKTENRNYNQTFVNLRNNFNQNDYEKRNLSILIEIDNKLLYLIDLDNQEVLKKYVVATGKKDTPTPIGSFKIIQKSAWGGGFGTRWMGLNVPWGKFGIHGTNKPQSIGQNASHGCIRMRNKDVEELYSLVKHNTPVTIQGGIFGSLSNGLRELRPGDRGADVQEVQKRLKMKGYYNGSIDGVYGDGLKESLKRFLKENNMDITDKIGYDIYEKLDIIIME